MNLSKIKLAVLSLIIANIIWGAALPIYKWSLEVIPPFTFAFLRFLIADIILLPFVLGKLKFAKADIPKLIFVSIISLTIQIPLLFFGLKLAPSINAPIIISSGPIILLGSSIIFLKEKVSTKLLTGTLVSFLGVLVIILKPALDAGFSSGVLGNFFLFLATVCAVVQTLLLKKITDKNQVLSTVFLMFLIAWITLLPTFLLEYNSVGFFQVGIKSIFGIAYAALFSSIFGYVLLTFGLKYINASDTGIFAYVDPIATIIVAIPLLNEVITPSYVFASALVFAGIYIAEGRIHYHPLHRLFR